VDYKQMSLPKLWEVLAKKYDMDQDAYDAYVQRNHDSDAEFQRRCHPGVETEEVRRSHVIHSLQFLISEGDIEEVSPGNYRQTDKGSLLSTIAEKLR
jgi:hypothetical protein